MHLYTNILCPNSRILHVPLDVQGFSCNCLGYINLFEEENSPSTLIVQRSSMNLDVTWSL